MTYAGLKSMIYAGLKPDDPRVKAATEWIRKHYSLDENPGMGNAGLYYYYQTFARALAAAGVDEFEDAAGTSHDWRAELIAALAKRQKPDGSWVNENARWMEGNPNLVTGYALLALVQMPRERQSPSGMSAQVDCARRVLCPAGVGRCPRTASARCWCGAAADATIAAIINETEAYIGPHDLAAPWQQGPHARAPK